MTRRRAVDDAMASNTDRKPDRTTAKTDFSTKLRQPNYRFLNKIKSHFHPAIVTKQSFPPQRTSTSLKTILYDEASDRHERILSQT